MGWPRRRDAPAVPIRCDGVVTRPRTVAACFWLTAIFKVAGRHQIKVAARPGTTCSAAAAPARIARVRRRWLGGAPGALLLCPRNRDRPKLDWHIDSTASSALQHPILSH